MSEDKKNLSTHLISEKNTILPSKFLFKVKEEPEDNDGENRNPQKRIGFISTGLLIVKSMIGSGILNVPLIFKTLGILPSIILSLIYSFITLLSIHFLIRSHEITNTYSYSFFLHIILFIIQLKSF